MKSTCLCNHALSSIHIMLSCWCSCVHLSTIEKSWFLRSIASRILTMRFRAESSWHCITSSWGWTQEKWYEKASWRRRWQSRIKLNTHLLISTDYSRKKWTIDRFVVESICVTLRWLILNILISSADDSRQNVYTYDYSCEMSQLYRAVEAQENRIQHRFMRQFYSLWTYHHKLAYKSFHQKERSLFWMLKWWISRLLVDLHSREKKNSFFDDSCDCQRIFWAWIRWADDTKVSSGFS